MTKNSGILLFGALILIVLSTACGPGTTGTPGTPGTPMVTETQGTPGTPTVTGTAGTPGEGTPAVTDTPAPGTTPKPVFVNQVCFFCIENTSHLIVTIPDTATFEVMAPPAGLTCTSVEAADNGKQIVLCHGPQQSAFQLKVCNGENCQEFSLTLQACAMEHPTDTLTPTLTLTPTASTTSTPAAGAATATSAGGSSTPTPTATATP